MSLFIKKVFANLTSLKYYQFMLNTRCVIKNNTVYWILVLLLKSLLINKIIKQWLIYNIMITNLPSIVSQIVAIAAILSVLRMRMMLANIIYHYKYNLSRNTKHCHVKRRETDFARLPAAIIREIRAEILHWCNFLLREKITFFLLYSF